VQDSSESAEGNLFETSEDCSTESYSSKVWSGQQRQRWGGDEQN